MNWLPIHANIGYIYNLFFCCTTSPTHHHLRCWKSCSFTYTLPPPFHHEQYHPPSWSYHRFCHSCGTASLWTCSTSTVLPPIFSCPFLPTLPSSAVLRALRPNASLFFSVCYHWHLLIYYLFLFHILTSSKTCIFGLCMWTMWVFRGNGISAGAF